MKKVILIISLIFGLCYAVLYYMDNPILRVQKILNIELSFIGTKILKYNEEWGFQGDGELEIILRVAKNKLLRAKKDLVCQESIKLDREELLKNKKVVCMYRKYDIQSWKEYQLLTDDKYGYIYVKLSYM